jgi:hypothetical protein
LEPGGNTNTTGRFGGGRESEKSGSVIVSLFGPPEGVEFFYTVIIKSMKHKEE